MSFDSENSAYAHARYKEDRIHDGDMGSGEKRYDPSTYKYPRAIPCIGCKKDRKLKRQTKQNKEYCLTHCTAGNPTNEPHIDPLDEGYPRKAKLNKTQWATPSMGEMFF